MENQFQLSADTSNVCVRVYVRNTVLSSIVAFLRMFLKAYVCTDRSA